MAGLIYPIDFGYVHAPKTGLVQTCRVPVQTYQITRILVTLFKLVPCTLDKVPLPNFGVAKCGLVSLCDYQSITGIFVEL